MSRIPSAVVHTQPVDHEIFNGFGIMGNEKINYQWTYEQKACGCSKNRQNTLTNTRLLIRTDSINCCKQKNRTDVSIFLRDIAQIRQTKEMRENGGCCLCCCSARDKQVFALKGLFGQKLLYIPEENLKYLQVEIPRLAGNEKLVIHH